MKTLASVAFLGFTLVCNGEGWHDQWVKSGSTWLEKWTNIIDSIEEFPKGEQIEILGAAVKITASHENKNSTPDQLSVSNRAIDLLLATPGYGQYFADEIERERKLVEDLSAPDSRRDKYDDKRYNYLSNILPQLPSPQTIRVLGEYLYDERDPYPPSSPNQDWAGAPENAVIASRALMEIGLRNRPVEKTIFEAADTLERQRDWYEKVKSGESTFSFVGQKVEYRFKADGSWETIPITNPPDDGPGRPGAVTAERPSRPQPPVIAPEHPMHRWNGNAWIWICGAATAGIALLGYLFMSRRKV